MVYLFELVVTESPTKIAYVDAKFEAETRVTAAGKQPIMRV